MKKFVIPVCILFAIGLGFLVVSMILSYNQVQYGKETVSHIMDVEYGGELTAEYNGRTTIIVGQNVSRVESALTPSEKALLIFKPAYNSEDAVTLKFSDGAVYIVAPDESGQDAVFILYSFHGGELYFSLKGYKTMDWLTRAISPEGIYNENVTVKNIAE